MAGAKLTALNWAQVLLPISSSAKWSLLSSQSRKVGVGRQEAVSRGSEDGLGVQRVGESYFCCMVFQMSRVVELPHNSDFVSV